MAIFEPVRYETEEILSIPIAGSNRCYVISGFADFTWGEGHVGKGPLSNVVADRDDDDLWVTHKLHIVVGREWHDVKQVSPTAAIAGYWFHNSDETDSTGIELENCKWDTVGVDGNTGLEKIRLKIKLRMCGGVQSSVTKISYHLVAIVTELSIVG